MSKKKILYVRPPGMQTDFEPLLKQTFGLVVVSTESYNEAVSLQRGEGITFFVICDRIFQYTEQGESGDYGSFSIRTVGRDLAQHFSSRFRMNLKKNPKSGDKIVILFLSNDTALLDSACTIPATYSFFKNKKSNDSYRSLEDYLTHFTEEHGDKVDKDNSVVGSVAASAADDFTATEQNENLPNIPMQQKSETRPDSLKEQAASASKPESDQGFFKKLSRVLNEPIGKKKK
jgi:hypothetical protein